MRYNEEKIRQGQAIGLAAPGFHRDMDRLSLADKHQRFLGRLELNRRVQRPVLHASVNFHPKDVLTDDTLRELGLSYLKALGLQDQPALLYRHLDAAHPHLHLLTVLIRRDGSLKNPFHAARHQAQLCCRRLEARYGLRSPDAPMAGFLPDAFREGAPGYGRHPTAESINRVVGAQLEVLRADSLDAFSAVLRLHGVHLIQGSEESFLRRHHGLMYQLLSADGRPVGVPVAASRLELKPVRKVLEPRLALASRNLEPWALSLERRLERLQSIWADLPDSLGQRVLEREGLKLIHSGGSDPLLLDTVHNCCVRISRLDHRTREYLRPLCEPEVSAPQLRLLSKAELNPPGLRTYVRRQLLGCRSPQTHLNA